MLYTDDEIYSVKKSILSSYDNLLKQLDFVDKNKQIIQKYSSYDREQNIKIKKKFVDYLTNGIDFYEAVNFLLIDFRLTKNIIDNVLRVEYEIFKRQEISKKVYTAHAMNKSGYKIKEIAAVLHKTPATIRNYLKISVMMDN